MASLNCFHSNSTSSTNKIFLSLQEDIIVSSLQIGSQLARNSEAYFNQLLAIFVPRTLVQLLTYSSDVVRSKSCNLVGNICRCVGPSCDHHIPLDYVVVLQTFRSVLSALIDRGFEYNGN